VFQSIIQTRIKQLQTRTSPCQLPILLSQTFRSHFDHRLVLRSRPIQKNSAMKKTNSYAEWKELPISEPPSRKLQMLSSLRDTNWNVSLIIFCCSSSPCKEPKERHHWFSCVSAACIMVAFIVIIMELAHYSVTEYGCSLACGEFIVELTYPVPTHPLPGRPLIQCEAELQDWMDGSESTISPSKTKK